ncbi:MAG: hypothetical protein FJ119_12360 [Deltaproteobacteria bacterium]|nr:hypothetical protein [Deltaproteobacteria bacterium]
MKTYFIENRFNYFLIVIVGLMVLSPFYPPIGTPGVFPLLQLCFTLATVFILRTLINNTGIFFLVAAVYFFIFFTNVIVLFYDWHWAHVIDALANKAFIIAFIVFLQRLLRELFRSGRVNADCIKGGICIYFLLGILWALLYRSLFHLDKHAFAYAADIAPNLFYFSFMTLTTVGYGEIVPVSTVAQMLASLEAVTGQIFLAVYIARLLGMHIAAHIKKD